MKGYVIFIWLLLMIYIFTATLHSEDDSSCPDLWKKSFDVSDERCPRFMYVQTGGDGLGDQLERIFLAMSLIHGWS